MRYTSSIPFLIIVINCQSLLRNETRNHYEQKFNEFVSLRSFPVYFYHPGGSIFIIVFISLKRAVDFGIFGTSDTSGDDKLFLFPSIDHEFCF